MISSFQDFRRKQDERTIRPQEDPEWGWTERKLFTGASTVSVMYRLKLGMKGPGNISLGRKIVDLSFVRAVPCPLPPLAR
jgi:hypothetical protein